MLDHELCYRAYVSRDSRFDGLFFMGVKTTGIYCRSVCPAPKPLVKNCVFFTSTAAAESEGFRPCLRCRPESAPGVAGGEGVRRLALWAASHIRLGSAELGDGESGLARRAGVSPRHLRRAITETFGVAPIQMMQTARLLLAKQLLTQTSLSVERVSQASGFKSLRRMQATLRERYSLSPSELRKQRQLPVPATLRLTLGYRPPLLAESLFAFLAARSLPGVEVVQGSSYARTWRSKGNPKSVGWWRASIGDTPGVMVLECDESLADSLGEVMACARRVLDLDAQPHVIDGVLSEDDQLRPWVQVSPGMRVPGASDGFELVLRAILGQQISVAAATTLAGRLCERYGEPISTPIEGLNRLSPTATVLASTPLSHLCTLGVVSPRAGCIVDIAKRVDGGTLDLEPSPDPSRAIAQLLEFKGIGPWTANYVAMRALRWPDAFPVGDLVLQRMLGVTSNKAMEKRSHPWRPWRAYAAMHLWKAASDHAQSEKLKTSHLRKASAKS